MKFAKGWYKTINLGKIRTGTTRSIYQPIMIEDKKETCPVHEQKLLHMYFHRSDNKKRYDQKLPFKLCPRCFE